MRTLSKVVTEIDRFVYN